jgi:hypothetical protein
MSGMKIATESPSASAPSHERGATPSSLRAVVTAYAVGCAVLMLVMTVFLLPRNGFQLFADPGYHRLLLKALEVMGLAFATTLLWAFASRRRQKRS